MTQQIDPLWELWSLPFFSLQAFSFKPGEVVSVKVLSKGSTRPVWNLFVLDWNTWKHTKVKFGDHSRGQPEGSLFNSFYIKVLGRAVLLSLDCSALPLIRTLYCWVLGKDVSSTIFKVFGMTWPGIEPKSPRPLANTLPTRPNYVQIICITTSYLML